MDLTVPESDGYIWDFNKKECRDRATHIVDSQKPLFLILSPECTPYSNIQNLNVRTPSGKAKAEEARRKGDVHLRFSVTLARRQMEGGRYFVYEHPKTASSWDSAQIVGLAKTEGVFRTELDQC